MEMVENIRNAGITRNNQALQTTWNVVHKMLIYEYTCVVYTVKDSIVIEYKN